MPTSNMLLKDHKPKCYEGMHPSKLVTPAESFKSGLSEIGHLAIKETLMKNKVDIDVFTIIQASSLRRDLQNLNSNKDKNSIASIDIVNV